MFGELIEKPNPPSIWKNPYVIGGVGLVAIVGGIMAKKRFFPNYPAKIIEIVNSRSELGMKGATRIHSDILEKLIKAVHKYRQTSDLRLDMKAVIASAVKQGGTKEEVAQRVAEAVKKNTLALVAKLESDFASLNITHESFKQFVLQLTYLKASDGAPYEYAWGSKTNGEKITTGLLWGAIIAGGYYGVKMVRKGRKNA